MKRVNENGNMNGANPFNIGMNGNMQGANGVTQPNPVVDRVVQAGRGNPPVAEGDVAGRHLVGLDAVMNNEDDLVAPAAQRKRRLEASSSDDEDMPDTKRKWLFDFSSSEDENAPDAQRPMTERDYVNTLLRQYKSKIRCISDEQTGYTLIFTDTYMSNKEINDILAEFRGINLTVLDLSFCKNLHDLNDLGNFTKLTKLYLFDCTGLRGHIDLTSLTQLAYCVFSDIGAAQITISDQCPYARRVGRTVFGNP